MKLQLSQIASPLGMILLVTDDAAIRAVEFADHESRMRQLLRAYWGEVDLVTGDAGAYAGALAAYFAGNLTALDALPVQTGGSEFQREVWGALRRIPTGCTTSYGKLAAQIGRPKACRAVGAANGANPVSLIVPCHRVIGHNGTLTGYGGGLHRKAWLLAHEARYAGVSGVAVLV